MSKKPTPQSVTFLTPDDLAPILARLDALEAGAVELEGRVSDHDTRLEGQDALLGEHEARLVALESVAPVEPPVEPPIVEPPTGQDYICPTVAEFLTALADAEAGDTITLTAGATYDTASGFTLRDHGGDHPITLRSSMSASLPAGQRVSPGDLAKMPLLRATGANVDVIKGAYGAGHWTLIGLAITTTHDTQQGALIRMPVPRSNYSPASESELPHHITIDRCYVFGKTGVIATTGTIRGVAFNTLDSAITNCHIADFRYDGADSQGIWVMMARRLRIENNYVEGAGENILFGGSASSIDGFVTSDVVVRANHLAKRREWNWWDTAHFGTTPGSAIETAGPGTLSCTGTTGTTTVAHGLGVNHHVRLATGDQRRVTAASGTTLTLASAFPSDPAGVPYTRLRGWVVKNLFEVKVGERMLIENNRLERNWPPGQSGRAVLFSTRNDNDRCPWFRIRDITFQYNWIKNATGCFMFADTDPLIPSKSNRTIHDPGPGGTLTTVGTAATFSVPHGLAVGDVVRVTSGAEAAPRGFGRMVSAVVDATQVTLNDTFRLGAGGAATNVTEQTWEKWTTLVVSQNLRVEHNVWEHIGQGEDGLYGPLANVAAGTFYLPANAARPVPGPTDVVIRHNTVYASASDVMTPFYLGETGCVNDALVLADNLINFGDGDGPNYLGPFAAAGKTGGDGNATLALFTVHSTVTSNVFYGAGAKATNQPAGNYWEPVTANVGWDDPTTGRFELTRGPYRAGQAHCASDGTDMGADVAAVRARVFGPEGAPA